MAYFYNNNNHNYETEFGEYIQTSSIPPPQDYEPSIYNLFDYDPTPFSIIAHNNSSTTAYYSTFTPSQPQSLVKYHYPEEHSNSYFQIVSNHDILYNQSVTSNPGTEFNAPGFDEYDLTPYGGGYDIVQTYGKPVPPSDRTCFPRDGSKSIEPKRNVDKPPEKPQPAKKEDEKPRVVENYVEDEKEVIRQIPSGYGLEAMDLCGSLFGYWPCMTKYYSERGDVGVGVGGGGVCNCDNRNECRLHGWCYSNGGALGAAEYLFGSSDPYVERRDGGGSFGQPIHCYERHYQEEPLIVQVDDYRHYDHDDQEVNSWVQSFRIF